jgi:hypothetical protein
MALPTMEVPSYELILPSTKKKVKYRPFLVKEYKILLTALEADSEEIARIVIDLVDSCTFKKLKMDKLAHFDIEYLFLQIRAKSVGEIANLVINCDCGAKLNYDLDLTKIVIENNDKASNKIIVSNNLGITLRYPKFDELVNLYDNLKTENIFDKIASCVESVYTDEEVFNRDSFTEQELKDFLSNFTKVQFSKLEEFFEYMPKVVQHIEKTCDSCGKEHRMKLEGLENFFV